jgi:hypothetical protein
MKRALLVACASLLLASCSLLGLDDYDVYACEPGERCDQLNEEIEDECLQYTCSASGRGCELAPFDRDYDGHPSAELCGDEPDIEALDCDDEEKTRRRGLKEECDGVDNDCDTFIDEDSVPDEDVYDQPLEEGTVDVSVAASAGDAPLIAITRFDGTTFTTSSVRVLDDKLTDRKALAFNDLPNNGNVCDVATDDQPCRIGQLALEASGDTLLGVGVQRAGCSDGQLRAGAGSMNDATLVLGVPPKGNTAQGIDVDSEQRNCTRSGECLGVQDPAIAVLAGAGSQHEQALAAWLAPSADACEEACACADAFQVMALGLFADIAEGRPYVDGSDEGHAVPIGNGDATGAPALVAFETSAQASGYFLAYPAGDHVALRFMPRFAQRELTTNGQPEVQLEADGARHVAWPERLLPSDDPTTPAGLALAYVEDDGALRFVTLELEADDASLGATGEPLTIARDAIAARPSLLYAPDGFTDDDASGSHGGWLVLWLAADGDDRVLRAVRIAERERRVLGEPIELARGAIDHPFTFVKQADGQRSLMRYGFVHDGALRVSRITCDMDN